MFNWYSGPFILSGMAFISGIICMVYSVQENWPFWYFWCGLGLFLLSILFIGKLLRMWQEVTSDASEEPSTIEGSLEYYVRREKLLEE